jgi:hypothetical protein
MARRVFLSKIIGDGLTPETAFRVAIQGIGGFNSLSVAIPNNPDGTPKLAWALCVVDANDFTQIAADINVDNFVTFPLNTLLSNLTTTQQNRIRNAIINRLGLTPPNPGPNATIRDVLQWLLKQLDGNQADISAHGV